ncbi:Mor transcription activator family protein [Peptoanaerobacter stomatis]|uniref:Mor transcription activator family protein n=1 Tax=Peptoanaerobacter stomatis TaxID=796937 RepID=J4W5D2_9FIRM|nr:Mor transcription activator family protein [Peptoanaerobacter stomatis]EJU21181.1 Mor transcription activator family protein [Peptoanaerobacter stomatis]
MLDKLTIDDIDNKEQRAIAEIIGIKAYISLVKNYGGTSIYILKEDSLVKDIRDNKIREEFNGGNYVYLAKKYNLSDRTIRDIIGNNKIEGQLEFKF